MCIFSPIRNDLTKHINKILSPAQSQDNSANLFMFMCFSFPEKKSFSKSGQPTVNPREKFIAPVFRGEHINFLALGQPAVCPRAIWTLTRAKNYVYVPFFSPGSQSFWEMSKALSIGQEEEEEK